MRSMTFVTGVFQTRPVAIASWTQNIASRTAFWVSGTWRNRSFNFLPGAKSSRGNTQPGVRWNTVTFSASFTSSGMICTPEAPVPITATRLPAKS